MACNFISELSKLRKLSAESVENTASFDAFKKYLHVLRPVESELRTLLSRVNSANKKTLVLLCGSAGDGKSHLLSYLRNADSEHLLDMFELYNDATESSAPLLTAIDTLAEKLAPFNDDNYLNDDGFKMILAINLGTLNNFIESEKGQAFSALKKYVDINEIFSTHIRPNMYQDTAMDSLLGKGTVISFKADVLNKSGVISDDVCLLEFPEKMGSEYMIKSASEIEKELDSDTGDLPGRLKHLCLNAEGPIPQSEIVEQPGRMHETAPVSSLIPAPQEMEPETEIKTAPGIVTPVDDVHEASAAVEIDGRKSMEVLFGTDIVTGQKLLWMPNDTNQVFHTNTGIIGTMGTGKTQFTKSVITQLCRDQAHNFDGTPLGILIFDYKGDYNESKEDFIKATNAKVYKPYHLPFNPLALTKSRVFKPLLPIHTANAFKDTLAKVYGLGAKQQNTLFSCITKAYTAKGIKASDPSTWENIAPTFDAVYSIYANDDEIKKNDSLAAAMDKLYQFQVFEGDSSQTQSLFDVLNGVVVIDLSGYDADIQSLIIAITLDLFYAQMQAIGSSKMDQQYRQLTKLILVDEADNFMCEGFPSLKKILKEGREFGVGTILSTQFLKHFGSTDDDYAKYILTWVVHNVADLKASDVEFVFKTESKSSETQNLFNDIKSLQKHHSIVKIGTTKPRYIEDKAFWELYKELKLD